MEQNDVMLFGRQMEIAFYFADVCVKKKIIEADYPPRTIREYACVPLEAISLLGNMAGPETMETNLHYWVYTFKEQIGMRSFRYDFDGEESDVKFAKADIDSWNIGFPEDEPNENVNLDKLTVKLRDNKKMQKLLLSFYRS